MNRRRRRRRHNPLAVRGVNPLSSGEEKLLLVLGIAGLAAGGYWLFTRYTLTLAPGAQSLKVPIGHAFTLKLPSGASWTSIAAGSPTAMPTAALASGSAPMQLPTSSAGEMVVALWKDSSGMPQTSTITLTS